MRHPAGRPGVTDLGEGLLGRDRFEMHGHCPHRARQCGREQWVHPLSGHVDAGPGGDLADPVDVAVGLQRVVADESGRRPGPRGRDRPFTPECQALQRRRVGPLAHHRRDLPARQRRRSQSNGGELFAQLGQLACCLGQHVDFFSHVGLHLGAEVDVVVNSGRTDRRLQRLVVRPLSCRDITHSGVGPVLLDGRGLRGGTLDPLEPAQTRTLGGHRLQDLTPREDLRRLLIGSGEHEPVAS